VDRPISTREILFNGWMDEDDINYITDLTARINTIISLKLASIGIILADFNVEYGRTQKGAIILADEAGSPEGCRFLDKAEFENGIIKSLDKDVFRKGTGNLSVAYSELFERIQKS